MTKKEIIELINLTAEKMWDADEKVAKLFGVSSQEEKIALARWGIISDLKAAIEENDKERISWRWE